MASGTRPAARAQRLDGLAARRRRAFTASATSAASNPSSVVPIAPPPPPPPVLLAVPPLLLPLVAAVIVSCALPERLGSAADTALTVTVAGAGRVAGAVYTPLLEILPTVELPPLIPLTSQVTAVFVVFSTAAVNAWVAPVATLAVPGPR